MLIGQVVFSIGVSFNDWGVMLSGWLIYGLAGVNIAIAKTALLALWFDGSEMSFAFGCAITRQLAIPSECSEGTIRDMYLQGYI